MSETFPRVSKQESRFLQVRAVEIRADVNPRHDTWRYDGQMVRRADDFGSDSSIDVVNPDDDTSVEALAAWIADLERDDDWVELPTTAAVLIAEDRTARGL